MANSGTFNVQDFYIQQLDNLYTDPLKSTLWRIRFGDDMWRSFNDNGLKINSALVPGGDLTVEHMVAQSHLMVQTFSPLPVVEVDTATIDYFGLKKNVATGLKGLNGEFTGTFLDLEDQIMYQAFTMLQETVVNSGTITSTENGYDSLGKTIAGRERLSGLSKGIISSGASETGLREKGSGAVRGDLTLELYNFYYHNWVVRYDFKNVMVTKVEKDLTLGYGTPALGKFKVKGVYDRWAVAWNTNQFQHKYT